MIEEGVLENPHVDACLALHMAQDHPLGTVIVRDGPLLAASDRFTIEIQGRGGHAAHPHTTVDPVVVGAHVTTALQSIVSRNVDPIASAVITVGSLHAGTAPNVIPDTASIWGDRPHPRSRGARDGRATIAEVATGVCQALGATAVVDYQRGVPATVNDPRAVAIIRDAAREVVGEERLIDPPPQMGGEDFSYFVIERPGAMFFVGSNNPERGLTWGHHHPKFDIDEESLAIGAETMARSVISYLQNGFDRGTQR
jgi:amidohydrolase